MKINVIGKVAAAVVFAGLVSGCADPNAISTMQSDVAAMRADIARAKASADKASADAAAAMAEIRKVQEIEKRYHRNELRK